MRLYSEPVEWKALRAHYERLFRDAKTRGETQETIAERGGLRQNKISKLLDIEHLGPQTETFIRAIEGLGMLPSSFFLQIEGLQTPSASVHDQAGSPEPSTTLVNPDEPLPEPSREELWSAIRTLARAQAPERTGASTGDHRRPAADAGRTSGGSTNRARSREGPARRQPEPRGRSGKRR